MNYILARRGWSWASGKALAQYFRQHNLRFLVTDKPEKIITVNWGNSACRNALLNATIITDKLHQLEVLTEREIPTLEVYKENPPTDAILVARKRNHQAGNDIIICNPGEPLPSAAYYTKFEKFVRELRIHAFLVGEELRLRGFKKVLSEGEENPLPIRNLEHGYGFQLVPLSEELKLLVRRTLEVLQLNFGCLDIGVKVDAQKYTVIEVNSAPSLINNAISLRWYANNIGATLYETWENVDE